LNDAFVNEMFGFCLQIIMVRLQRVTFMALYNYLGLSHELMNPVSYSAFYI